MLTINSASHRHFEHDRLSYLLTLVTLVAYLLSKLASYSTMAVSQRLTVLAIVVAICCVAGISFLHLRAIIAWIVFNSHVIVL